MPKMLYPENCPECGHRLSRSRRRGWFERLMTHVLKIRVLRCHRCQTRYYSPPALIFHAPEAEEQTAEREPVAPESANATPADGRTEVELDEEVVAKMAVRLPLALPAAPPAALSPRVDPAWTQQTSGLVSSSSSSHWQATSTSVFWKNEPL